MLRRKLTDYGDDTLISAFEVNDFLVEFHELLDDERLWNRAARMIVSCDFGTALHGYWMDFPEEHWTLAVPYERLDVLERMRLEAVEQATRWLPDQFKTLWLHTHHDAEYVKLLRHQTTAAWTPKFYAMANKRADELQKS